MRRGSYPSYYRTRKIQARYQSGESGSGKNVIGNSISASWAAGRYSTQTIAFRSNSNVRFSRDLLGSASQYPQPATYDLHGCR